MSNEFKKVDIKYCTHYFFADLINMKNLELNIIKIDKKSYKNILFNTLDRLRSKILDT